FETHLDPLENLIPNRPQKASEDAAFLKKGSTQKFFLFFINDLFSNTLLERQTEDPAEINNFCGIVPNNFKRPCLQAPLGKSLS
ncbi:hypothetical protein, partial [Novacetimonas hansenii]|uniref:hypothetical protein n=1 Tax=Novacetimonas hansenii TaxID=436 RepID=UPI0039EB320A